MNDNKSNNNDCGQRRRWHVGREFPIATIVVLLFQTIGVIWLAASTVAKVEYLEKSAFSEKIVQTSVDRRQDEEAIRSETRITLQLENVNKKLDRLIEGKR